MLCHGMQMQCNAKVVSVCLDFKIHICIARVFRFGLFTAGEGEGGGEMGRWERK